MYLIVCGFLHHSHELDRDSWCVPMLRSKSNRGRPLFAGEISSVYSARGYGILCDSRHQGSTYSNHLFSRFYCWKIVITPRFLAIRHAGLRDFSLLIKRLFATSRRTGRFLFDAHAGPSVQKSVLSS